jgi:hypothetical protein
MMLKPSLSLGLLAVMVSSANAFECTLGVEGGLKAVSWSAEAVDTQWTAFEFTVQNNYVAEIESAIVRVSIIGPIPEQTSPMQDTMLVVQRGPKPGATKIARFETDSFKDLIGADPSQYVTHLCVQAVKFVPP